MSAEGEDKGKEATTSEFVPKHLNEPGSDDDESDGPGFKHFGEGNDDSDSDDGDDLAPGSPIAGPAIKVGWVKKRSARWQFLWQSRYLVLSRGKLSYFAKESDERARGVINLEGTIIRKCTAKDHSRALEKAFGFEILSYFRSYVFKAKDAKDLDEWVSTMLPMAGDPNTTRPRRGSSGNSLPLTNSVRVLVSRKKRRYQEDDFDLDLSYITPRILAMGFPSDGSESLYRNPRKEVIRFLDHYHPKHHVIVNLCSERDYQNSKFQSPIQRFPFDDHNAPPLELISDFCKSMDEYLDADTSNTAAIHCKAGKGRTGVMICAWLVHTGLAGSAEEAFETFALKRTYDGKGVTIPSQKRYIKYHEIVTRSGPRPKTPKKLKSVVFYTTPNFGGGFDPRIRISMVNTEPNAKKTGRGLPYIRVKNIESKNVRGLDKFEVDLDNAEVAGDVKVEMFHKKWKKKSMVLYTWFHTSFVPENNVLTLKKVELDKAVKDKKHQYFSKDFKIEFHFEDN